jgi:predicted ATPase
VVGVTSVRVRGFRSALDVTFTPGQLCVLVGEARAGKSTLLEALWLLLNPLGETSEDIDTPADGKLTVRIEARLATGGRLAYEARPPHRPRRRGTPPEAIFLPSALRASTVVPPAATGSGARIIADAVARLADGAPTSDAAPARALVAGLEQCVAERVAGVVLLVEEPELYLRPQTQRYLRRLLRRFAELGNQVLFSTHSPALLDAGRLEELALVSYEGEAGTSVVQPRPLGPTTGFRALTEFDAERSELFLSRTAILVEGRTEKIALPFVFRALGEDADREGITVVECGGKPNIPVFSRVCEAVRVPFVVMYDRDAPADREPIPSEQMLNALIEELAGPERTVVLVPDFEAVADLPGHSIERVYERFSALGDGDAVPAPLARAARLALALARGGAIPPAGARSGAARRRR